MSYVHSSIKKYVVYLCIIPVPRGTLILSGIVCGLQVSGGAKRIGKCSSVCGPFAITWAYWSDCGKPESK